MKSLLRVALGVVCAAPLAASAPPSTDTDTVTVPATIAGNTADCYPILKSNPPICDGEGEGDNHNEQLPQAPKFISAAVNGAESAQPGSKGRARIHIEFPIAKLAGRRIHRARVELTTHRGTSDRIETHFYVLSDDGNGTLEDADFERPGSAIPGAVMPVPPLEEMPLGASGEFGFDVTELLRGAVARKRRFFQIQGRDNFRRRPPAQPLLRGLEVYSTCSCSDKSEWPRLVVAVAP